MKFSTLLISLFISQLLFSQSIELAEESYSLSFSYQTRFTIQVGIAIPTGDFGDNDIYEASAGLAENALLFDASLYQSISESIYLSFSFRFHDNKVDNTRMKQLFNGLPFVPSLTVDPWKTRSESRVYWSQYNQIN